MQSNTSTKMDNCEVKFGDLTRTVATKNVTISALGALFAIHNVQTCWPRGLSRTFLQMKMDRFSLNWKVSAYMNWADTDESRHDGAKTYMLFAGWEVRILKNCNLGLENAALGQRPWA